MFNIVKVNQGLFPLQSVIDICKFLYQPPKIPGITGSGSDLPIQVLRRVIKEILFCRINRLLKNIPVLFHQLFDFLKSAGVHSVLVRCKIFFVHILQLKIIKGSLQTVKVLGASRMPMLSLFFKLRCRCKVKLCKLHCTCCTFRRSHSQIFLKTFYGLCQLFIQGPGYIFHGRTFKEILQCTICRPYCAVKPAIRLGKALNGTVHLFYHFPHLGVVSVSAELIQKVEKLRLPRLVAFFQQSVHGTALEDCLLTAVAYFKIRFYIRQIKISVNHIKSKGVKGAYAGRRQKVSLFFKEKKIASVFLTHSAALCPGSLGYLIYRLAYGVLYLFLHFGSCRVGEGYYKHSVNGTSVFDNNPFYSLNKNRGLAGTRRCRHKDVLISQLHGFFLLRGPIHNHSSCFFKFIAVSASDRSVKSVHSHQPLFKPRVAAAALIVCSHLL